jgi:hypothetical protein
METAMTAAAVGVAPALNWLDQDERLRELWSRNQPPAVIARQLGRSVAAIMTRAARLGLPRRSAPGRKPGYQRATLPKTSTTESTRGHRHIRRTGTTESVEGQGLQASERICLMCLNKFSSEGRHNRICSSCKGTTEYAAGSSIPDITFGVAT